MDKSGHCGRIRDHGEIASSSGNGPQMRSYSTREFLAVEVTTPADVTSTAIYTLRCSRGASWN